VCVCKYACFFLCMTVSACSNIVVSLKSLSEAEDVEAAAAESMA